MLLRLMCRTLVAATLLFSPLMRASELPPARASDAPRVPQVEPEAQFPQERCVYVEAEVPRREPAEPPREPPAPAAP